MTEGRLEGTKCSRWHEYYLEKKFWPDFSGWEVLSGKFSRKEQGGKCEKGLQALGVDLKELDSSFILSEGRLLPG